MLFGGTLPLSWLPPWKHLAVALRIHELLSADFCDTKNSRNSGTFSEAESSSPCIFFTSSHSSFTLLVLCTNWKTRRFSWLLPASLPNRACRRNISPTRPDPPFCSTYYIRLFPLFLLSYKKTKHHAPPHVTMVHYHTWLLSTHYYGRQLIIHCTLNTPSCKCFKNVLKMFLKCF